MIDRMADLRLVARATVFDGRKDCRVARMCKKVCSNTLITSWCI